ncbi:MAG: hypothetical protein IJ905_03560 [Fibrobacter sp.]|nr:hypothetical protein [Fibrobacter sp.]
MEVAMLWIKTCNIAALSLAFIFAACGGDSGSNVSNDDVNSSASVSKSGTSTTPTSQSNLNYSGMTYKTYEGLVAEQPCELSLNLTVAHVSSTNKDYLCRQEASSGKWSWQPYQGGNGTVMGENGRVYETFTDSRDGHVYKMVTIGTQTWMAENLDFASDSSFCYVNWETGLDECGLGNRGRFYMWSAAVDSAGIYSNDAKGCGSSGPKKAVKYGEDCAPVYPMRGVCPQGWHLPDTTEWRTLFNYTGCSLASKHSKCDLLIKEKDHLESSDAYGFSAFRLSYLEFRNVSEGVAADFWASTIGWSSQNAQGLHHVEIFDEFQDIVTPSGTFSPRIKRPVRCIKNTGESQSAKPVSSSSIVRSSSSISATSSSVFTPTDGNYFVDTRDGQTYRTVTIGSQTWMAQNLNYEVKGSYCYNKDETNCAKYGRLYAIYSKVCPVGWHLPTIDEWNTLFKFVGGPSVAGKKLKSTIGWNDSGNGTDDYRFSALPAGRSQSGGSYSGEGFATTYWGDVSTKESSVGTYTIFIENGKDGVIVDSVMNDWMDLSAYSIRCIKGESAAISSSSAKNNTASSSSIANGSYTCGNLWCGKNLDYNVNLGNNSYVSWFDYAEDFGSITYPVSKTTTMKPVIDACKGICGHFDNLDVSSFAGVGFPVSEDGVTAKDISSWQGICVSYKSDKQISLRISFGDDDDWRLYGYATPEVSLPKSAAIATENFAWTQFKQPAWAKEAKISGTEAVKKAVSIRFEIGGTGSGDFAIYSVGKAGSCK